MSAAGFHPSAVSPEQAAGAQLPNKLWAGHSLRVLGPLAVNRTLAATLLTRAGLETPLPDVSLYQAQLARLLVQGWIELARREGGGGGISLLIGVAGAWRKLGYLGMGWAGWGSSSRLSGLSISTEHMLVKAVGVEEIGRENPSWVEGW